MASKRDIHPKKYPTQRRAVMTVDALLEAATYILAHEAMGSFTANHVAERAGVNIASFYQYFPNKEALLFMLARATWERQAARLSPLLRDATNDHATRLRCFIREFFLIEAAEIDLRRALRDALVDLRETDEYRALLADGATMMREFIASAAGNSSDGDIEFVVRFVVLLTTSFAERTTDAGTGSDELMRQADLLTEMLLEALRIVQVPA